MQQIIIETCNQINTLLCKLLELVKDELSTPEPLVLPKNWRENYFSRLEVAQFCEVSERHVYRWIDELTIVPTIKVAGRSYYGKQYIFDLLTSGQLENYKCKPPST